MSWTQQQRISYLVSLPWTVALHRDSDDDIVARAAELPFLTATGSTEKAAARDLFDGLWSAMDAMLTHGDVIPLPEGAALPWERGEEPAAVPARRCSAVPLQGGAWDPTASVVAQTLALSA